MPTGILSVPFMLGLVLDGADVKLDAPALLLKLALTIFLPLVVGKVNERLGERQATAWVLLLQAT